MKRLIFIVVFVLLIGGGFYVSQNLDELTKGKESVSTFEDKTLGLSFEYPSRFGSVEVRKDNGETGEKFTGIFSDNEDLQFGGMSNNFSAGRSGVLTDTRGFNKRNGGYFFKFVIAKPDLPIQPGKVIDAGSGEILLLDDQSFEDERAGMGGPIFGVGKDNLAAVSNLSGETFKGIVFWNMDTDDFSSKDFETMLKSVKVTTPEEVYPKEYSNANEDYTVEYPKGWYPHEFEKGVIFTQNEFTDEASDTEGYALGGQFIITMENLADTEDVETYDDWLELYGIDEDSEFLKEKETVTVGDIEMIRLSV
jgi:hypothetical protein